ncbi:MAG: DUF4145 domain-containing protein [Bryobacterales bacterium]|nr:DUF4145 domain-containing protein [Bryobacterales bacterium]
MNDALRMFEILPQFAAVLWKAWPKDMEAARLGQPNENRFSLSGTCPHCSRASAFLMVTGAHAEEVFERASCIGYTSWAVLQCQACKKFILGATFGPNGDANACRYVEHYPLGRPNDEAPLEIPENIRVDFQEALRCRFVDAHNATVEMCRRAVQASCNYFNAPSGKLVHQIDWLAAQGIITTPLKDMAHRVRLGGNLGAHPPEDPDDQNIITIGSRYADAVIEFTRDFFQHVFVMPERLKKFTFR